MERLGVSSTARASLALYNSRDDVDRLADALAEILEQGRLRAAARANRLQVGQQADQPDLALRSQVPEATSSAAPAYGQNLNAAAGAEPAYPAAAADSPQAAANTIAEDFALLPDWPTRHDYLIELGERLPPMPPALKTDANLVRGCQSTVYLAARRKPDSMAVIEFLADSDAAIVRGLIALLQRICSGQSAESVLAFDVDGLFSRIGLDTHLSLSRRNGLAAMVQRLKALARDI
jgi:cysteine desulfurase/selenocysteine lyase